VIYDVLASWAVPETSSRWRRAAHERFGHAFHPAAMREDDAVLRGGGLGSLATSATSSAGRLGNRAVFADVRALSSRHGKLSKRSTVPRPLLPDGQIKHAGRRRAFEAGDWKPGFGPEGRVSHSTASVERTTGTSTSARRTGASALLTSSALAGRMEASARGSRSDQA